MKYNFDEIIDRKGTSAYKVDLLKARYGTDDLLPLWVADMDFKSPDFILEAIRERANHEILGYTVRNQDFFEPMVKWVEKKHDWIMNPNWMGFSPGILPAIALSINAFTNPGDKIIIQPPIYPPFMSIVKNNHREVVFNQLLLEDGRYKMDFDGLESLIDEKTKMILLCSPHNPGGRIWSKDELIKLAEICARKNVLVISDEIHADLALKGNKHYLFPTVSEHAFNNSITLIAPSKTFNIAGLVTASYIIPNESIRLKFQRQIESAEIASGNIFAYTAARAAYQKGEDWLSQMMEYVQGNIDFVTEFIKENLPKIKPMIPEASFLIWLDFRQLDISDYELRKILINESKLAFNDGPSFGPGGEGFQRINVGCSRELLREAMDRLKTTFEKY
ncbi:MAG: PatB family C-S lyase [Bacteroidales bacterium]|nr:PatB family C-S lyase [Bacteroidales bacterium]